MGVLVQDRDLRLRSMCLPDDAAVGVPWYRDPEVLYFSEGPGTEPYDAETVQKMYEFMNNNGEGYIVEVRVEGVWKAIGDCALHEDTLPIVIGEAAYRSRGYGRRVLALLVARARELGWDRLLVRSVYTFNVRSRRLYEGAGFHLTGTHEDTNGQSAWSFELRLQGPLKSPRG